MSLKITVIGTGYLGATHAAAMAELGFEVLGLDVVPEKIEKLERGEAPMYEPGLEELLRKHVAGIEGSTGRLRFTMDWAEVGAFGDVHFLCINTPQRHGEYAADMSYVESAFASLAPHLTGPVLVVGKSTVPVGSAERLARFLAENSPAGEDAELASPCRTPCTPTGSWWACAASGRRSCCARCTRRRSPRARRSW
jgi:UDPglucose 6-dehydrogenase